MNEVSSFELLKVLEVIAKGGRPDIDAFKDALFAEEPIVQAAYEMGRGNEGNAQAIFNALPDNAANTAKKNRLKAKNKKFE